MKASQGRHLTKVRILKWFWMVLSLLTKMVRILPIDCEIWIYQKLQDLRKRDLTIITYTEELNKLTLRGRRQEEEVERVERYLNGLI